MKSTVFSSFVLDLAGEKNFESFNYRRWIAGDLGYRICGIQSTNSFAILDIFANKIVVN